MTSIYEAEIRKKPWVRTVEDQFTSRVFGALDILSRGNQKDIIRSFLKRLAEDKTYRDDEDEALSVMVNLKKEDISTPIILWGTIGGKQPDVRIETNKGVILIEVKTITNPSKKQLVDHILAASQKESATKMLAYFLLTGGYERPGVIEEAQEELKQKSLKAKIHWRRWSDVSKWFSNEADNAQEKISRILLEETCKLMKGENMSGFTGIKAEWEKYATAFETINELYFQISNLMGEVKEELKEKRIKSVGSVPDLKDRHKLDRLDEVLHEDLYFYFVDEKWTNEKLETDPSLQINFSLNIDPELLGPAVGLSWRIDDEKERNEKEEIIRKKKEELVIDEDKFEVSSDDWGIWINNSPDPKELEQGKPAVNTLVDKLVEVREFANKVPILREATGYGETRGKRRNS